MRNPRVQVRMEADFYEALLAFAAAQNRTPANVLLHATQQYLSQHHAWRTGMRGRHYAHVRKGIETVGETSAVSRERLCQTGGGSSCTLAITGEGTREGGEGQ